MRRQISSRSTFFYKVVFPTIWIGGFAMGTLALFLKALLSDAGLAAPPAGVKWLFFAVTVVAGTWLYRTCAPLKKVTLTDGELLVSNFRSEISVPLTELEAVTENPWINAHPVTLHFRHQTPFGQTVTFVPRLRVFGFLSSHPVVLELQRACDLAGRARR